MRRPFLLIYQTTFNYATFYPRIVFVVVFLINVKFKSCFLTCDRNKLSVNTGNFFFTYKNNEKCQFAQITLDAMHAACNFFQITHRKKSIFLFFQIFADTSKKILTLVKSIKKFYITQKLMRRFSKIFLLTSTAKNHKCKF